MSLFASECFVCGEDNLTEENGGTYQIHHCRGVACFKCVQHHEAVWSGVMPYWKTRSGIVLEKKNVPEATNTDPLRYKCLNCNLYINPLVNPLIPKKIVVVTA